MSTLQHYDELPYDRLPFPEAEPDFLSALARLHGFSAGDARSARVLELGCAQGGNLIPMAGRYPQSEFVGVDLSRAQVEEGREFIRRAALSNIRLLHGDIAALPDDLGEFDFIIAHGVYSWVSDFVRVALLAACRRHLKPQGIAYVSFNVEVGWRTYGQIRRLLLQHDKPDLAPMQRVEQARSTLAATQFEDKRLQNEADYMKGASASYLFHEYLSDSNNPHTLTQFLADAADNGLRFLGEAGPRRARVVLKNDCELSDEARYQRWLDAEANLDDALNTRFRYALLVRDDGALPQPQQALHLKSLAFSAELRSDDEMDFAEATVQYFEAGGGERFPVSHPLLKAFLVVLSGSHPEVLDYDTAVSHSLGLAREYGYGGGADEEFLEALLDFSQMHGVHLHTCCSEFAAISSDLPQVSLLTRTQASNPVWPVTNVFHMALDMDEWGRRLLAVMDSSLSVEALGKFLLEELGKAGISASPEQAAQHVQNYLEFFRRQGLMR